ncbi:hypothetical protein HanRHA438_Chr06g0269841 [Helianthus annuus]|nr:hypothetical protein HanOQP8_Chr06g0222091 [Helianthus annuus]KAJ0912041.1 hypothetical protein HanRHA438_Chr06g0269841 [Helianthus annuus]
MFVSKLFFSFHSSLGPNHNCTLWGSTLWGRMGSCQRGGDPAYIDQFTLPKLVVAIKLMLADPEVMNLLLFHISTFHDYLVPNASA